MGLRYCVRSLQLTMRAAKASTSRCMSGILAGTTNTFTFHWWSQGHITCIETEKSLHSSWEKPGFAFFFFSNTLHLCIPSDFCPEHQFIYIYTEFQMTFYHLSFSLFQFCLLQQETCSSHSMSKLQRAAALLQHERAVTQIDLGPAATRGAKDRHLHLPPLVLGVSNQVQALRKCSCSTQRHQRVVQVAVCWPDTAPLHMHSHREKPRGNQSSSCSAWMHFVSCTVLLHWPENRSLGRGRKHWLNKLFFFLFDRKKTPNI